MFTILNECGYARYGVLSTIRGQIKTPSMLLSVRQGDLHGLTFDEYNSLLRTTGLIINPLDFESADQEFPQNAIDGLSLKNSPFVLGFPRDPLRTEYLPSNNDKGVIVALRPGQRQISPSAYARLVKRLSPDAMVALWDQAPLEATEKRKRNAVFRTDKWVEKILTEVGDQPQLWLPITGGKSHSLRKLSVEKAGAYNPVGYVLDEFESDNMTMSNLEQLEFTLRYAERNKAKMLPGKFSPIEMLSAVVKGVDLFDSSLIWNLSLKGQALIWNIHPSDVQIGKYSILDINNRSHKEDSGPLMNSCLCYCCTHHSKGYIHHLLSEKEITGEVLLQIHNVQWMLDFFEIMQHYINSNNITQLQSNIKEE